MRQFARKFGVPVDTARAWAFSGRIERMLGADKYITYLKGRHLLTEFTGGMAFVDPDQWRAFRTAERYQIARDLAEARSLLDLDHPGTQGIVIFNAYTYGEMASYSRVLGFQEK